MLLLNYKPVLSQPTGIGVYANAVLPAFDQFEHALIPGGGSGSAKERLKRLAWSQFQLPRMARKLRADLIFTPAPEGYLGKQFAPQVVMVHDLRPLSHLERSLQSVYFRNWVPPLLNQCKHILTNSNYTASEIQRATGVSASKITVTPLGYDIEYFYLADAYQRLHHRPYLLHIGQAYPHKNMRRLIKAFSAIALRFPEVDLLLLGKPHPSETSHLKRLISELDLSDRIILKSYVPYNELPNWYRGAIAFVYPSLWEGFGLPIVEAMACGCPVITSYGSGMEETAQGSALLADPLDTSHISESIDKVLSSSVLRDSLRTSGLKRVKEYQWEICRELTYNALAKII